ncbi:MAG: hypothetical protein AABZ32_00555 [Bacteroidota bacterium]
MKKLESLSNFAPFALELQQISKLVGGRSTTTKTPGGTKTHPDGTTYTYCWDCVDGDATYYCKDGEGDPVCKC